MMPETARASTSPDSLDPPHHQNEIVKTADMNERQAKKQRLRELQDSHDCVKKIVNHMGKHYRTADPPPWLDLRAVAGQLIRSNRAAAAPSSHTVWKGLRESLMAIQNWTEGHETWREAVKLRKMPHIGTRSDIIAVEFIDSKQIGLPKCLMQVFQSVKLDFVLDWEPPRYDKMPEFWKGAEVTNPHWRRVYMEARGSARNLPFPDDLTDLVLSVVCQKVNPERGTKSTAPTRTNGDEDASGGFDDKPKTKKVQTRTKGDGKDLLWKEEIQGAMSRIAETANETLAAEKVRLLGKRYRKEIAAQPQKKRQKPAETPNPQEPIESIEESDDDRLTVSCGLKAAAASEKETITVSNEERRYRILKAGYKRLREQDQQLATVYNKLEDDNATLREEIGQITAQQKELRSEHDAVKQEQGRLADTTSKLEQQKKSLEEKNEQLSVKCADLVNRVQTLEDKAAQTAAQSSALEDENKLIRSQMVSLMARAEALETARKEAQAEREQAGPPEAAGGPRPGEVTGFDRSRHHSIVEVPPKDRAKPDPREDGRGTITSGELSNRRPPRWTIKGESSGRLSSVDMSSLPQYTQAPSQPRNQPRARSRFPRILDMPTFDLAGFPEEKPFSHRMESHPYPSRPTNCYSIDTAEASNRMSTPYHHDAHSVMRPPSPGQTPDNVAYQVPLAGQTPVPAPSPGPESTCIPPSTSEPTFANPLPTLRAEYPSSPSMPFTTATFQPHPPPNPEIHSNQTAPL
ncbi:hypothetical protein VTI74DRAFT_3267 [Chaetomium olivicolor]